MNPQPKTVSAFKESLEYDFHRDYFTVWHVGIQFQFSTNQLLETDESMSSWLARHCGIDHNIYHVSMINQLDGNYDGYSFSLKLIKRSNHVHNHRTNNKRAIALRNMIKSFRNASTEHSFSAYYIHNFSTSAFISKRHTEHGIANNYILDLQKNLNEVSQWYDYNITNAVGSIIQLGFYVENPAHDSDFMDVSIWF